uniref:Uncharacterized protein n=1 Tax=Kuenenia stuttgartiensis TaxID=174633 RepID=Q1PW88_KUEST|nr:unknown protein [Candidatus Kuenenia stuttgartiensis]
MLRLRKFFRKKILHYKYYDIYDIYDKFKNRCLSFLNNNEYTLVLSLSKQMNCLPF